MNRTEQNTLQDMSSLHPSEPKAASPGTPNLAARPIVATASVPPNTAPAMLRAHWPEYLMEAALLGAFMVLACVFGVLYEFPRSPVRQAISSSLIRRMLMGASMGLTAIAIIYSPWGKQSGADGNPSVTFTFFRLRKIKAFDAVFYIGAQFIGAAVDQLTKSGDHKSATVSALRENGATEICYFSPSSASDEWGCHDPIQERNLQ